MQIAYHLHCKRPLPVEHFGNARTASNIFFQVATRQPPAFHVVLNGINGIRKGYGMMLLFIDMYQRYQHLKTIAISSARLGIK
ncbi:MAG: hypothetical protein A2X57_02270 [Nitrospirae bacterium GWD2_57_8]|nr:MAG: hypothetical protein A2X57_02270 [Nitrospirae bacterium GWD2_57_8]